MVHAPLPPGLRYSSSTAGLGSYDEATGLWTIALVPGQQAILATTAIVDAPVTVTGTATIQRADQFDPTLANNSAQVALAPMSADLALSLGGDVVRPGPNPPVTFTLTLTNNGPDVATGVQVTVTVPLPPSLVALSVTPSQGTFDPATGLWTTGPIAPKSSLTLEVVTQVIEGSDTPVTATIVQSDRFDATTGDWTAAVAVLPRRSDPGLSYAVDDPQPDVGEVVTFVLSLTNTGPDDAGNIRVVSPVPEGFQLVTAAAGSGTYDPVSGLWTIPALGAGGTTTLAFQARLGSPTPDHAVAQVLGADTFDTNPANDVATARVSPRSADLSVAVVAPTTAVVPASENNTAASVIAARPAPPPATGRLGGIAFSDLDGDGARGPSKPGFSDLAITLRGIDTQGRLVQRLVTTAPDGTFEFAGLPPGVYELSRSGPGGGRIVGIVLPEGGVVLNQLFPIPVSRSRLEGSVYYDLNHNGRFDTPDFGIANATVILSGLSDLGVLVQRQVVTDADGSYAFDNLPPGTYSLSEVQPARFHDYRDNIGTLGGTPRNDRFEGIAPGPGAAGMGYNFGELQGRGSHLRYFVIYLGNAEARLRARRVLDPARFDANHPRYASALAQGRIPAGQGAQARARLIQRDLPTVGTRRVVLSSLRRRAQARNGTIGPT